MPQTDILTYFSQYFWLVITLFFFIIYISTYILPSILEIIYIRNKLSKTTINTISKYNIKNQKLDNYFFFLTNNLIKVNNNKLKKIDYSNSIILSSQYFYLNNIINFQLKKK